MPDATSPPVQNHPLRFELIVDDELDGVRIDSFLVRHFRNYTPWRMQRMAAAGAVTIEHRIVGPRARVFAGQRVQVRLIEPPDKLIAPEPIDVRTLHEDPWLIVCDKPAGMVCHPTGPVQRGTLANAMQSHLDVTCGVRGLLRPGIVHRLDRQTSGAIAVVCEYRAHRRLSMAFEQGRVSKSYVALVEGAVRADDGEFHWPIGRARQGSRVLMSARGDAVGAKPSRTGFRVLQRFRRHTLVEAMPRTGRNHQIRVHFAQAGHPLLGDEFYDRHGAFKRTAPGGHHHHPEEDGIYTGLPIRRHALHASRLALAHPVTDVWLEFCCELPDDFRETITVLRDEQS